MSEIETAYAEAEAMIKAAIERRETVFWLPGSMTPARCHLILALSVPVQRRFMDWVLKEGKAGQEKADRMPEPEKKGDPKVKLFLRDGRHLPTLKTLLDAEKELAKLRQDG